MAQKSLSGITLSPHSPDHIFVCLSAYLINLTILQDRINPTIPNREAITLGINGIASKYLWESEHSYVCCSTELCTDKT